MSASSSAGSQSFSAGFNLPSTKGLFLLGARRLGDPPEHSFHPRGHRLKLLGRWSRREAEERVMEFDLEREVTVLNGAEVDSCSIAADSSPGNP